ncbi:MAG: ABC transporter permease [Acidimicrobiia bacterium]
MSRVLTIAKSEFTTLVKTKAFIIGIVLMPVLMAAFFFFMSYVEGQIDNERRPFVVVDHTGVLYDAIATAAQEHNAGTMKDGVRSGPEFVPERLDAAGRSSDDLKIELSERVRSKDLFAFVEIPAEALTATAGDVPTVRYYAENTSYQPLPDWLRTTLNEEITKRRYDAASIDQALIERLNVRTPLSTFGLVERGADGTVTDAQEVDALARVAMPTFFLVLMFMSVMTSGTHLLNAIIEEKMSKISEVLLGSVTPFQLMAGKLLGVVSVSLLLTTVYLTGGFYVVFTTQRWDLLDVSIIAWFIVFMICAALLYGSVFLALGSACSDLKDAQSMMQPAMILIMLAYLGSFIVIQNPESNVATVLSFFPTTTPFAMLLRMAMPPGPPIWHVLLGVAGLIATTVFCVWAGSRIFRVGILMQGKAPTLPELVKWIGK